MSMSYGEGALHRHFPGAGAIGVHPGTFTGEGR